MKRRILLALLAFIPIFFTQTYAQKHAPKLIVLLSYDQMRGDFTERWGKFWGNKGFNRIAKEGVTFPSCYFGHANTMTGPGHAVLMTGSYPAKTGIVSNDFFDLGYDHEINCVEDARSTTLGMAEKPTHISPRNLQVPTLGDYLLQRQPQSKVVGIALKDRAAVLMAGRSATAAYWFEDDIDGFTSSDYYMKKVPTWVSSWNKQKKSLSYSGKSWTLSLPESRYPMPDSVEWERPNHQTFPHDIPIFSEKNRSKYYEEFLLTPYAMDILFDFTRLAVEKENLGRNAGTDILCVGVSTTDFVGHSFGPDSRETFELYLDADRLLGEFLDFLDRKIGKGNYVTVLASDHGICPYPEHSALSNLDAGRIGSGAFLKAAETYLDTTFPTGTDTTRWIKLFQPPSLFLNETKFSAFSERTVVDSLRAFSLRYRGVGIAVSAIDLRNNTPPPDTDTEQFYLIRHAYFPARSGNILIYPKLYWLWSSKIGYTSHGTPYSYDMHSPLLISGKNIPPAGIRNERVSPSDIAPTLAKLLGIEMLHIDGKILPIFK